MNRLTNAQHLLLTRAYCLSEGCLAAVTQTKALLRHLNNSA
jgi:invasion protein IalB